MRSACLKAICVTSSWSSRRQGHSRRPLPPQTTPRTTPATSPSTYSRASPLKTFHTRLGIILTSFVYKINIVYFLGFWITFVVFINIFHAYKTLLNHNRTRATHLRTKQKLKWKKARVFSLGSAPIGAWKCTFPTYKEITTDRPTNRRTDRVIGKIHSQ